MAKITFIGSGRTATALGKAIAAQGHTFIEVWSRTAAGASSLAKVLNCGHTTELQAINASADIYIVAVSDDAIAEVASHIHIGEKIIAHTSGFKSKDILKTASPNYGILYPFISMSKESDTDFTNTLVMIEGSNEDTLQILDALARTISNHVRRVEEDQRQALHLAAVFANNFTNHMYHIAEKILKEKGQKFDEMRPLIEAHLSNISKLSPSQLQTGPAIRGDQSIIEAHLHLLDNNIGWKRLYLALTESIQDMAKSK